MFLIKFWISQENHFERSKFRMVLLVSAQYYLDQHYQLVKMLTKEYTDVTSLLIFAPAQRTPPLYP